MSLKLSNGKLTHAKTSTTKDILIECSYAFHTTMKTPKTFVNLGKKKTWFYTTTSTKRQKLTSFGRRLGSKTRTP